MTRQPMTYPDKARILYIGTAGRRIVEPYEWNRENGYTQQVEGAEMVARLLQNGDFVIFEQMSDSSTGESMNMPDEQAEESKS